MTDDTSPTTGIPLRLRYAAVSDVGRHRKDNQDAGYASEHLLVVADGVGGAAYGDVASSTAVHLLRRVDRGDVDDMATALAGAVHRIHEKLAEMVEEDSELEGTSTTVTAALFDGRQFGFVHAGDSRAYLLRDGGLGRLTKDHTFVQTLVDDGQITEAESRVHPHRNIILRAVDSVHDTEPDLFHVEPQLGDRVMLCSDGCSGSLTDEEIGALLAAGTVDVAAVRLVQSALDAGSTDNVTVVVAEVVAADQADDPDTTAAATTGPMLVGSASAQPRRGGMLSRALARHRDTDTGELDPVDEGASGAGAVDPEELRYAPRPPRNRHWLRRLALVAIPLLLVAGALAGGYAWTQNQYYVAPDGPYVAIFRGVDLNLPGLDLSHPHTTDRALRVDALTPFDQEQLEDGIVASDLSDAQRILANLRERVTEPGEPAEPSPGPTASPTANPTENPSDNPTTKPTKRPSRTPSTGTPNPGTPNPARGPSAAPAGGTA